MSKVEGDKAAEDDGMTSKFRRKIAEPFTEIFNKSVGEGIVRQDWKIANVTLMFKNSLKQDPCKYRPVSLTFVGILRICCIAGRYRNSS